MSVQHVCRPTSLQVLILDFQSDTHRIAIARLVNFNNISKAVEGPSLVITLRSMMFGI